MALQFWFGASGSGKSTGVQREMIRQAMKHPEQRFYMVVPDQFTMQTQKQMIMMHPDGGILNIDVLSFGRLSHRVFEEVGKDERPVLDDTGKCLLLRKVAEIEKKNIPVLAAGLKYPGYIQEVKSVLSEFLQYGLKPEDVRALAEYAKEKRPLQLKLKDLSIIYEAFLKECEAKFITKEETLDLLRERLPLSETVPFSTYVFDGFTGFTPIQNKVIEELLRLSKDVIVTLEMDNRYSPYRLEKEDFLFHLTRQTVYNLQNIAQKNGIAMKEDIILADIPVKRFENNLQLSHLERNLFREESVAYEKEGHSIEIIKTSNVRAECALMCQRMFALIKQKGYRYRDIAIVTADMGRYEMPLRRQFEKYGVPYFMDTTKSMLTNPFVAFLRNALAVLKQGFGYREMFRFLRSGMTDFTNDEIDRLENYVRARGIRGYSAWKTPFTHMHRESAGNMEALKQLDALRERIANIFAPLQVAITQGALSAEKWCELIYTFCVERNIEEKLEAYATKFEEKNELSVAIEYRQIYRLIMDLLNQIASLLGKDTLTIGEFSDILDAGFGEIRVRTIPQGVDLLVVGDIERTRLKDIKALFFLGVNDGNLPQSGSKGGLISDMEREFLLESGRELAPTPAGQMFIEQLYLYMNLTKPSEYLYLSYAAMEDDGSTLRPAYLIAELQKLFPKVEVQIKERAAVLSLEDAKECLAAMLCEYASGVMNERRQKELFALYGDLAAREECKAWLSEITEAAFITYCPNDLEQKLAQKLYGDIIECSISSLERFAGCHYAHFLSYGLRLQEREEYGFESVDMGNVMHDILQMFGDMLVRDELEWTSVDAETVDRFVERATEEVCSTYGGAILKDGAKYQYFGNQLKRIVRRTIKTLQVQLSHGTFRPYAYEEEFRKIYNIDQGGHDGGQLLLKGRIDRIDICEQKEEVFVKVVDYKSGSHKFDLNTLYYGISLQLAVYLGQTIQNLKKRYPDKNVLPAAMLYYRMVDPILKLDAAADETVMEEKLLKALNTTGAVSARVGIVDALDEDLEGSSLVVPVSRKGNEIKGTGSVFDPEILNGILDFAGEKTIALAKEMLAGRIDINPMVTGEEDACKFCAYKGACGFDGKIKGYEKRRPEEITPEEFERRRKGGNEVHA